MGRNRAASFRNVQFSTFPVSRNITGLLLVGCCCNPPLSYPCYLCTPSCSLPKVWQYLVWQKLVTSLMHFPCFLWLLARPLLPACYSIHCEEADTLLSWPSHGTEIINVQHTDVEHYSFITDCWVVRSEKKFVLKFTLLGYSLHIIKFIHFKCTVQLISSVSCIWSYNHHHNQGKNLSVIPESFFLPLCQSPHPHARAQASTDLLCHYSFTFSRIS